MTNVIETAGRAAIRPDTPPAGKGRSGQGSGAPRRPGGPGRPPIRRLLVLAGIASLLAHLLILRTVRIPMPTRVPSVAEVRVDVEPVAPARLETASPPEAPVEDSREPATEMAERPAPLAEAPEVPIARPRPSERAPDARTIRPTTLAAPLAPLVATRGGVGRQSTPVDARRLQIMRAESLLAARLADLPGAGVPEDSKLGLAAGGGITVPIPWGGFLPENRKDDVWRAERCAGKDSGEADKPGEREARGSQCD